MNVVNSPKFVSLEQAKELIKEGYFALDPHCHSSYSYDVPDVLETNPKSVIAKQVKLGLKPILSDHDTLNGYNYLKKFGKKIIACSEISITPKIAKKIDTKKPMHTLHINVFGITNHDLIILEDIAKKGNLDEFIKYLKQNDLDYMYNHPFWHPSREKFNWRIVPGLAKNYFDVLELNATITKGMNDIVIDLSKKLHKGISSGSDSHTGNPGSAMVIAEGKNFKDFWENVKLGNSYIVRKDMHVLDIVKETSTIINQTFNSNTRPIKQRKFTPATNVKVLDKLATSVTSGSLKNKIILKKVIEKALQGINYSAGPILAWKLHTYKEKKKENHIGKNINSIINNIKNIRNKFVSRNKK